MAFSITLAGQDITLFVDQLSIKVVDSLGQSSGAGSSALQQGRAGTIEMNSSLGPAATAVGAGTIISSPQLVRMGEIVVRDATNTVIWGGYATKYTDTTTAVLGNTKQNFTTISGVDYEAHLGRILVHESFVAQTDVQILRFVLQKYAPWINLSGLPATSTFLIPVRNFKHVSVLQVIQTIAGITGYLIWVDFAKALHYSPPTSASTAPFDLSDTPDFIISYPHYIDELLIDDNSALNRITFYGGKRPSGDITQDVSPLANGNNKIFPTAYYPRVSSDGNFHITLNGVEQVYGYETGDKDVAKNSFLSDGGLAQVLINPDAHNFTFDIAPALGATVLITYQYEFPMEVTVTDENSHRFFGDPYLDGYISDENIFDAGTAVQRCRVLLSEQSFGLVSLKASCWQAGLRSGQIVRVKNTIRGINSSYLVQSVEVAPLGAGNFVYHLTLGAWNWNIIDVIVKLAQNAAISDNEVNEPTILIVQQLAIKTTVSTSWLKKAETVGPYYARSAAVGDGHDAYPGFFTIAS